jgi:hypothetical protein
VRSPGCGCCNRTARDCKKRGSVSSWAEAIRAYNGGGARARRYRDTVVTRAEAAAKAQKAGKDFVPGRL